jgi:hypothetical protein
VPTDKPVAAVETATESERTDSEQPEATVLLGTQPEVDYDAREARMRADMKAAKDERKAAKAAAIAEIEARDDSLTEADAPFSDDIRPDFTTMDEEGIRRFMRVFTKWLRNRDAVVRGPSVTAHEIKDTSVTEVTREQGVTPETAKVKDTMTVYEGFYEWEYAGAAAPITIRRVHVTEIEALRDCASEAFVRRHEV